MTRAKKVFSFALALALSLWLRAPAFAAETAANIQLTKTEGTVTVSKSNGKSVSMRANMRLYNGYNVTTAEKSYAWINLDSTKLMKLDASSSVEVRKNGSKLEVNVKSGSVSFDVSEKLGSGESLNVSTSTMSVGIRGTCGWARVTDQWVSEICILEGRAQCVVMDPVSCQLKSAVLSGGDTAQCVVYPQDKQGDKCDILMKRQTTGGIPGFVLTELVRDVELCDMILEDSGLDVLADLAKTAGGDPSGRSADGKSASPEVLGLAERVRAGEEAETAQKLDEIRKEEESQEHNVSKDPVWEQGEQPGSSGGGSSGGTTPPAPVTYTVTFNSRGGSAVTSATVAKDGTVAEPTAPEREGHTFDGWYKEAACTTAWDFDTDTVTGDVTLYAKWTAIKYKVTFYRQNGNEPVETQIDYGERITKPADPTMDGYNFGGWYKEETYENAWNFDTDTVPAHDVNLYAKWTLNQYTVTFNSRGGSNVTSVKVEHGSTVTEPAKPTQGVYTFDGWYKDAEYTNVWNFDTDTVTGNVTLYAKWIPVTISFDINGFPSASSTPSPAAANSSGNLTSIPSLTSGDANCTFTGWYTEPTGGEKVTTNNGFDSDKTVYAHWSNWKLNEGTLTISGKGNMPDYSSYDAMPWKDSKDSITTFVINAGVTSIGNYTFSYCSKPTSVTIPNGVTRIGASAFMFCTSLDSVNIPEGVTIIGLGAFDHCYGLASIKIPSSVTSIASNAFNQSNLSQITVADGNPNFAAVENVLFSKDMTQLIQYPIGKNDGSYSIPASVTSIGDFAFSHSKLTSITIPGTVTSIGYRALYYCQDLSTVTYNGTMSQWNSVTIDSSSGLSGKTIKCTNGSITIP